MTYLVLLLAVIATLAQAQLKFGGNSGNNNNNRPDEKLIFGNPNALGLPGIDLGSEGLNSAANGALLGLLAGVIGSALLGGGGCNNCCGRRKRQAVFEGTKPKFFLPTNNNNCCRRKRREAQRQEDPDKKIFGSLFGGSGSNCGCGRRKRQSGDEPNKKIFGSLFGGNNNCGYNQNQGYNQGYSPYNPNQNQGFTNQNQGFNNQNQGFNNQNQFTTRPPTNRCVCDTSIQTNEVPCKVNNDRWCYVTIGSNCGDGKQSSQYRNQWSYQACNNYNSFGW